MIYKGYNNINHLFKFILAPKQKWVPLEIDIPKGKRDNSPKIKNDFGKYTFN